MTNIYPWFFPRARRTPAGIGPSRAFQDQCREARREILVYPMEGGFGSFVNGFARKFEERGGEIISGASDLHVEFDSVTRNVEYVKANGRCLEAPRVYWCAPPESLADLLSMPFPEVRSELFVLGSFEFERPIQCEFTELIVADPEHFINRISFPGLFSRTPNDLVQIEFAYPRHSDRHEIKESYWLEKWVASLQQLGIVQPGNTVVDFDLKVAPMMYNSFGIDGAPLPKLDFSDAIPKTSNLRPVMPTLRKDNINTRLPQFLEFVIADLLGRPCADQP